jgi:hypothetical protein
VATATSGISLDQFSLADRFRPHAHVVWTRHADAIVLLDAERGLYYTLNDVAARIWELLAAGEPVLEMLRVIGGEFEVEPTVLEADVLALLGELRKARLMEWLGP